jgi:hypothetical protein
MDNKIKFKNKIIIKNKTKVGGEVNDPPFTPRCTERRWRNYDDNSLLQYSEQYQGIYKTHCISIVVSFLNIFMKAVEANSGFFYKPRILFNGIKDKNYTEDLDYNYIDIINIIYIYNNYITRVLGYPNPTRTSDPINLLKDEADKLLFLPYYTSIQFNLDTKNRLIRQLSTPATVDSAKIDIDNLLKLFFPSKERYIKDLNKFINNQDNYVKKQEASIIAASASATASVIASAKAATEAAKAKAAAEAAQAKAAAEAAAIQARLTKAIDSRTPNNLEKGCNEFTIDFDNFKFHDQKYIITHRGFCKNLYTTLLNIILIVRPILDSYNNRSYFSLFQTKPNYFQGNPDFTYLEILNILNIYNKSTEKKIPGTLYGSTSTYFYSNTELNDVLYNTYKDLIFTTDTKNKIDALLTKLVDFKDINELLRSKESSVVSEARTKELTASTASQASKASASTSILSSIAPPAALSSNASSVAAISPPASNASVAASSSIALPLSTAPSAAALLTKPVAADISPPLEDVNSVVKGCTDNTNNTYTYYNQKYIITHRGVCKDINSILLEIIEIIKKKKEENTLRNFLGLDNYFINNTKFNYKEILEILKIYNDIYLDNNRPGFFTDSEFNKSIYDTYMANLNKEIKYKIDSLLDELLLLEDIFIESVKNNAEEARLKKEAADKAEADRLAEEIRLEEERIRLAEEEEIRLAQVEQLKKEAALDDLKQIIRDLSKLSDVISKYPEANLTVQRNTLIFKFRNDIAKI